ncbi:MAG: universal stress protein [Bacteroidales bacterium]
MKKIIVPVDFSEESLRGIELAIKVANGLNASVEMVHVIREHKPAILETVKGYEIKVKEKFEELRRDYESQLSKGNTLTYVIHKGKVHSEVVKHARYSDAEMIVSSTHGASGFEELFTGSNAMRIMAYSELPVMMARKDTVPETFRKILLPIDETVESRQKVPFTTQLAKAFNAEIIVLAILPDTNDAEKKGRVKAYEKQVKDYLRKYEIEFTEKEKTGSTVESIMDCVDTDNADLISVMAEEEITLSPTILGSHVQELLRKAKRPLLCIHQRDIYKGPFFPFVSKSKL